MSSGRRPEALLKLLGVSYFERPNRLAFSCPFHHDTDPSAGFYLDTGLAACFSCGYTLDVTAFYAKFHSMTYRQADKELAALLGEVTVYKPKVSLLTKRRGLEPAEALLQENKLRLPMLIFASLGESLDRIWTAADRGYVLNSGLDKHLEKWYTILGEEIENVGKSDAGRSSRDSPDDRFQKGMGEVPGAGREDGFIDLD